VHFAVQLSGFVLLCIEMVLQGLRNALST